MIAGTDLLRALPVPAFVTDERGYLTFFNAAAAALWGRSPVPGETRWCGAWRLYRADGAPVPPEETPPAALLRGEAGPAGAELVAERPDGVRVSFRAWPAPITDGSGRVVGTLTLMTEEGEHHDGDITEARLAAIVASSGDAIVSKTLDGRITSWNAGATRIFGYEPDEIIGQHITRLVPPELHEEEAGLLARLRAGERIEHFDTVRVTKDGRRVDLSLTVSPIRDRFGNVVGASKVGRDITERKRNEALQRLLFDELNHRVKNMLAMIQSIANESLRRAARPGDFVAGFNGRIQALARAHDLLVQGRMSGADVTRIVREEVVLGNADGLRISSSGPFVMLEPRSAVQLALVLHELATNARKYGALSVASGRLAIGWTVEEAAEGRALHLTWQESGVPGVSAPTEHGFGTSMIERSLQASGGGVELDFGAEGLTCEIRLPLIPDALPGPLVQAGDTFENRGWSGAVESNGDLAGLRVLLVEDEPLVAMDIEAELTGAGCLIVGSAGTLESAGAMIAGGGFDIALLDANLGGRPVDNLAADLTRRDIPFAFATGYGREALPAGFQDAPLLVKPFGADELLKVVRSLAGQPGARALAAG